MNTNYKRKTRQEHRAPDYNDDFYGLWDFHFFLFIVQTIKSISTNSSINLIHFYLFIYLYQLYTFSLCICLFVFLFIIYALAYLSKTSFRLRKLTFIYLLNVKLKTSSSINLIHSLVFYLFIYLYQLCIFSLCVFLFYLLYNIYALAYLSTSSFRVHMHSFYLFIKR